MNGHELAVHATSSTTMDQRRVGKLSRMIRRTVRIVLVASLVVAAACGPDSPRKKNSTTLPSSSSIPVSTTKPPVTTSPDTTVGEDSVPDTMAATPATSATTKAPGTTRAPGSTAGTAATTSTTVAELPGGIDVSATSNSVLILSDGAGPLRIRSITETTGNGITLDYSLCATTMPSGNVCIVYLRTNGLPSGTTVTGRVRVESNDPASPHVVDVSVTVP